ncbi:MAG: hypothetical protein SP1CHLAM54_08380 [Chlamydiia bacterium]|nr:hypothetical protein [Chlamydiia bacterium]MCH9615744.1 hypothetical protein [Chlamydiia bacterium]MCH9628853.1 hypothetical protein [Chlamydiia bacterium]
MKYKPHETFLNLPEEKQSAVTGAALQEFSKHSFQGASLSDIVRKAGISKGSLYQYFRDKKHLYLFLVEQSIEAKLEKLKASSDLFTFLNKMKHIQTTPSPEEVGFLQKVSTEEHIPEAQKIIRRSSDKFFKELLKNTPLNSSIDKATMIFVLTTLFTHFGQFLNTQKSDKKRAEAFDSLITLLEHGIRR